MKTPDDFNVTNVYNYGSSEDLKNYYNDWAHEYDDYAQQVNYILPQYVAMYSSKFMLNTNLSILDIGCGTGIVGEHLIARRPLIEIDGVDISKKMLNIAKLKTGPDNSKCYKKLHCQDLTKEISTIKEQYDFIVSAGTFTLGHLGSDDLIRSIKFLKHNGKYITTVKGDHFDSDNFNLKLSNAVEKNIIKDISIHEINAYNSNHNALNKIIVFTKV